MIAKKYLDDIIRLHKQETKAKYETLVASHKNEDEVIKIHLDKIQNYFRLMPEDKNRTHYIADCLVYNLQ